MEERKAKPEILIIDDMHICYSKIKKNAKDFFDTRWSPSRKNLELRMWKHFDLYICDFELGDNDPKGGFYAIDMIRSKYPGSRILATSSKNKRNVMMEAGADCFLWKKQIFENTKEVIEDLLYGNYA